MPVIGLGRESGAVTVSSQISCIIVSPIGIMKVRDMRFGNIVSGDAGSIVLSPDGGRPVVTGNVALETSGGIVSSASFQVTDGLGGNLVTQRFFSGYSITLPNYDIMLVNETGKTMRVSNFTSNASASGNGIFKNGESSLSIGATLYVNAEQGLGNYVSSTPFPVTVNFY